MTKPPKKQTKKYTDELWGFYGFLGTKANAVRFIQTSLPIAWLDKLDLVADLPGSERWPVRQLFQRDIDIDRVTNEIIPYFQRPDRIKFFNPITVAALPIGNNGGVEDNVDEKELAAKAPDSNEPDDWGGFEAEDYYLVSKGDDDHGWARFSWHTNKVKLVAIDGQHRLSALKRIKSTWERDTDDQQIEQMGFMNWTIPIILYIAPPASKAQSQLNLLEKTRDIFVTINKQAKPPTRCRTILLNDYSITAMCCQELLDHCHSEGRRGVPLLLFDWRARREGDAPENLASFIRVEELEDIHASYLMKADTEWNEVPTPEQREALFVDDMEPPLNESDSVQMREQLRKRYRETLMLAILGTFEQFEPFKGYVQHLQKMIEKCTTDIEKHALSRISYGMHHAEAHLEEEIRKQEEKMLADCQKAKGQMPELFQKLVGLRGVFAGLALARDSYQNTVEITSWSEVTAWYVEKLNEALKDEFFDWSSKGFLRHIAVDHNGIVINYKHDQVLKTIGPYVGWVVCARDERIRTNDEEMSWYQDMVASALLRGYRRELRPGIQEENPTLSKPDINKIVEREAQKKTRSHITRLTKKLGLAV